MRYFGGKFRIGKSIASIINGIKGNSYHEPFCGMYGVGRHVTIPNRSGSDLNPDLILLLNSVQNGWNGPREVSEELYQELKGSDPSALRGFVGFGCSFGGKFFGGYARDGSRNFAQNAHNHLKTLRPKIQNVVFTQENYLDYSGKADILYCDPPYQGTTKFSGSFDSEQFWEWVRKMSSDRIVLVSEYEAPKDFEIVWAKSVRTDMNGKSGKLDRVEKLFRLG